MECVFQLALSRNNGTFAPLPDAAKWLLSGAMLLGRLEFFTVLVLLTSRFWQG